MNEKNYTTKAMHSDISISYTIFLTVSDITGFSIV